MGQYADLFDDGQDQRAALRVRMSETAPDQAAEALRLARRYSLPPAVAKQFAEDYRKRAAADDAGQALQRSPRLRSWIAEDQNRADIAQDDIATLAGVEQTLEAMRRGGATIDGAWQLARGPKPALTSVASGVLQSLPRGFRMMSEGLSMQAGDLLGVETPQAMRRYQQEQARVQLDTPDFDSPTAKGVYGGLSSVLRQIPGIAASIATRSTAPALATMGLQVEGEAYGKYRARGATAGEATLGAVGEAATEVLTEKLPMGFIVDRFGKEGARSFLAGMLLREVPSEQVATLVQDAIDTAVANPEKTWEQYLAERPEAAYQTLVATVTQAGVMGTASSVARRLSGETARAQQAEEAARRLGELQALGAASKVQARDGQTFREFIAQAAEEEGDTPTELFVDGKRLADTLNQSAITMEELAAVAPVAAQQLGDVAGFGDVRVPVSEFMALGDKITPLLDHIRVGDAQASTRAEAGEFLAAKGEEIKAQVEQELQRQDDQATYRDSIKGLEATFQGELDAAGRFKPEVNKAYASLLANFYGATAVRLGMTPQELLNRYRVKVEAQQAAAQGRTMEQADAPDTPAFAAWFGDSKVVDAQGKPLVVYHGTRADIEAFDGGRIKGRFPNSEGFYFTSNPSHASVYADSIQNASEGFNPASRFAKPAAEGGNVMPAYVSLQNPKILTVSEWGTLESAVDGDGGARVRAARAAGHDGVIVQRRAGDDYDGDLVIAFKPEQIKSATGNRGTFDPADPSILNQSAYHGTPHAVDRFSLHKIGTGEGAQSFGYGLYFAGKREVAEHYRKTLSDGTGTIGAVLVNGEKIEAMSPEGHAARLLFYNDQREMRSLAKQMLKEAQAGEPYTVETAQKQGLTAADYYGRLNAFISTHTRKNIKVVKGNLYQVELPEDSELLDYDKSIGSQPAYVKEKLKASGILKDWKESRSDYALPQDVRPDRGGALYALLSHKFGGDQAASQFLHSIGIQGMRYKAGQIAGVKGGGHNYVIWDEAAIREQRSLYQGEETPRAQISLPQDFASESAVIRLLERADLSSFIHESGHLFLEIHADLAVKIQASIDSGESVSEQERGIVADFNRVLEWFGMKDAPEVSALTSWAMMSLEEKRQFHEQFARGFEAFAFEGKAPSLEMAGIFARFRSWLMQVYQTMRNLSVTLTDDVRGVMGRMLASDLAIEEAEAARSMGPLFADAEKSGLTLDEFNAYQALAGRATQEAITELAQRSLRDMKWLGNARDKALKARQREVEDLRREVRAAVRLEVMAEPVYRAWQFLTGKARSDETAAGKGPPKAMQGLDRGRDSLLTAIAKLGGINRDSARRDLSTSPDYFKVPSGVFGKPIFRKEGGLAVDYMAEALAEQGYLPADEDGKHEIRDLEDRISAELNGEPQYSYWHEYGDGLPSVTGDVLAGKLRTSYIPREALEVLKARRMVQEKDGLHPDQVAELFGFEGGDQLVDALRLADTPQEAIEHRTDQVMLERYGDITSEAALRQAADEAVHSEMRARVIATELKALRQANKVRERNEANPLTGGKVDVMARAAKVYAAQVVARQRVRDLRPGQFAGAEARSGKLAEKALASGKLDEAAMHKRNQLINTYATKAAYDGKEQVRKALEFFKKVNTGSAEKVSATRDVGMVNVARAVLAEYGLGTRGDSAAEYLRTVEANDPAAGAAMRDKVEALSAAAMPYRDMPLERFLGLVDQVQDLWNMAKRTRQMEIDGKLIDRTKVQFELAARLDEIGVPERVPGEGSAVTDGERRTAKLRSLRAGLRRVESWVDQMDGGKLGPFRRYVWQPIKEAADAYRGAKAVYLRKYRDLLGAVDLGQSRIDAPTLGYVFGKSSGGSGKAEVLHALLHTGNASNKRKLLLGRGWAEELPDGTLDTGRWDAFIASMVERGVLGRKEFDFAQGVWDLLEQMKPLAQKAHKDVFGHYFDEVTAEAFTVELDGQKVEYRGGYVPATADPEAVQDAAVHKMMEDETASLAFAFPSTNRGFTKGRVEYNTKLLLDLRHMGQHLDKVLLFSHMEQPIRDVRRILTSKDVATPLGRIEPEAFASLLTPWLARSARQSVVASAPGDGGVGRFFGTLRSRAGMAAMFANMANTAQQITGLSLAALKVPPRHLLHAAAQWVAAPRKTARAVAEASQYMAQRMDNDVALMGDEINAILLNPNVFDKAQAWTQRHAYFMQQAVDNVIGPIVWQGAYNDALEQGHDERDSRRLADAAVRQTQGSTLAEDIARAEGGGAVAGHPFVRLFTQFYGYFNMQANLLGTEFANVMHGAGLRKGMGRGVYIFTLGFLAPALVAELIVQAFRGGPDDEDKDGEWLDDWMAALGVGTIRNGLAMVPVVGQIGSAAVNMGNSKPYDDRISTSPAISMVESAVRAPFSAYKAFTGDGSAQKAVRDVATLISLTTGLPANAVAKPIGYAAAVSQGDVEPTSPADAVRGALTGVASPGSK